MRVGLVHDYLSQRGGAERLVLQLARCFPEAPIHTSFWDPAGSFPEFGDREIITSPLQRLVTPSSFRKFAPVLPLAFSTMDLRSYDAVVVSSSAFAHFVRHPRAFVYCHTPPRFAYSFDSYGHSTGTARLAGPPLSMWRQVDRRAARAKTSYVANSAITAARVASAYGRTAEVIYPPVWTGHLPQQLTPLPNPPAAMIVARLMPYKRVDLAIAACSMAGLPLTVVGDGPDRSRLEALPQSTCASFLGRVPDADMAELFRSHSVVLAPGIEDFGFGPVEANWAGRPVVSVDAGGGRETVIDGVNGRLVGGHDPGQWAQAIADVLAMSWSPEELRATTERFTYPVFEDYVRTWVR